MKSHTTMIRPKFFPDAVTWTRINTGNTADLYGATAGNGQFVIVGDNCTWNSTDGVIWRLRSQTDRPLRTVQFRDGHFIAAGANGQVMLSTDGRAWTSLWLGESWGRTFWGLHLGAGGSWLVGDFGTILHAGGAPLLPGITIEALDATASEVGPRPARIRIRRTGDLSQPINVRIRIEGTATQPDDYVITGPLLP